MAIPFDEGKLLDSQYKTWRVKEVIEGRIEKAPRLPYNPEKKYVPPILESQRATLGKPLQELEEEMLQFKAARASGQSIDSSRLTSVHREIERLRLEKADIEWSLNEQAAYEQFVSGPSKPGKDVGETATKRAGRLWGFAKKHKKKLILGGIGAAIALRLIIPRKGQAYDPISGLHPGSEGMGAESIRSNSDFGSGYQGIPESLMGQKIDPDILRFREEVLDSPDAKKALEAELKAAQEATELGSFREGDLAAPTYKGSKLQKVDLSNFTMTVEDADSLVLERKGLAGIGAAPIQVRMSGIDAPEVGSHSGDPLESVRINQAQPYGEEASDVLRDLIKNQNSLSLMVNPGEKTYGRYLGALVGDKGILNVDLIRQGAVTALPFGDENKDIIPRRMAEEAERKAREEGLGLWKMARYKALGAAVDRIGQDITHNTITRIDKLAQNLNLGAYGSFLESLGDEERNLSSREYDIAERLGYVLRKTHGSKKRAYNKFDGLHPGSEGLGAETVRKHSEFGSGYQRTDQALFNTRVQQVLKSGRHGTSPIGTLVSNGMDPEKYVTLYHGTNQYLAENIVSGRKLDRAFRQQLGMFGCAKHVEFHKDSPHLAAVRYAGGGSTYSITDPKIAEKVKNPAVIKTRIKAKFVGKQMIADEHFVPMQFLASHGESEVIVGKTALSAAFPEYKRKMELDAAFGLETQEARMKALIEKNKLKKQQSLLPQKQDLKTNELSLPEKVPAENKSLNVVKETAVDRFERQMAIASSVDKRKIARIEETLAAKTLITEESIAKEAAAVKKATTEIVETAAKKPTGNWKKWAIGIGAVGLVGIAFSAKDDAYNTIEGLHPGSEGMGRESIRQHTPFGSGVIIEELHKVFKDTVAKEGYAYYDQYKSPGRIAAEKRLSSFSQNKENLLKFPAMGNSDTMAGRMRAQLTEFKADFASRWDKVRKIATEVFKDEAEDVAFSKLMKSDMFKKAISTGLKAPGKFLGEGGQAQVWAHQAKFAHGEKEHIFDFVVKKGLAAPGGESASKAIKRVEDLGTVFNTESKAMKALGAEEVPSLYGRGQSFGMTEDAIIMEKFNLGTSVADKPLNKLEEQSLYRTMKSAHAKGITHTDMHSENVVRAINPITNKEEVGVLDWGMANRFAEREGIGGHQEIVTITNGGKLLAERLREKAGRHVGFHEFSEVSDMMRVQAHAMVSPPRSARLAVNSSYLYNDALRELKVAEQVRIEPNMTEALVQDIKTNLAKAKAKFNKMDALINEVAEDTAHFMSTGKLREPVLSKPLKNAAKDSLEFTSFGEALSAAKGSKETPTKTVNNIKKKIQKTNDLAYAKTLQAEWSANTIKVESQSAVTAVHSYNKKTAVTRNAKFRKNSEASVGIGLVAAKDASKGHANFNSTQSLSSTRKV